MKQNLSLNASSSSAGQEIPCILWNLKIHYYLHKSPMCVSVLSQIDAAHTLPATSFNAHFNIILPSTSRHNFNCNCNVSSVSVSHKHVNPLNAELNPICCLLALLGAHCFLNVSRLRVKSLTLRLLMSYINIYIWSTNS